MKDSMEIIKALVKRNQVTSESNEKMQLSTGNPMNADWVWEQQTDIWGEQWTRERGKEPSSMWITNLSSITEQHLKRGVSRTISERLKWPPSLPEFLSLCLDFDTTEAYNRMIQRKPALDDVEYYTRADVSFRCKRQLPEDKAIALFNKVFKIKLELKRKGQLPIRDQKLLASESMVTDNDRAVSDRGNGGTKIEQRMKAIIANRKN